MSVREMQREPVSNKGKVVSVAIFPQFEQSMAGLNAAIEEFGGGEVGVKFVVNRFNTQIGTDEKNKQRGSVAKGPSKEILNRLAQKELALHNLPWLQSLTGTDDEREAKIEAKLNELVAQMGEKFETDRLSKIAQFQKDNPDLVKSSDDDDEA